MKKNLGVNAVLNLSKTALSIIFPLITYPYVSRVLGVENIGKVNYTASFVSYFALIAALGLSTYAIREGGKVRGDQEKLEKLGSQLFTLNILSTLISYILLFIFVFFFVKNPDYQKLILLQSTTILFTTLGIDWVNVIFEDFLYVTVRSLVVQLLSLILIFLVVKTAHDYYIYAAISVITSGIICVLNLLYCRRYMKLRLVWDLDIKKHMSPILILFSGGLAISIYANSSVLILERLQGVYYVGLYSLATRVYTILKTLLASIYSVAIPNLSHLYGARRFSEFKNVYTNILSYITLLLIPLSAGLIVVSSEIIAFMGGRDYADATLTLQLLALSLIGAIFGGAFTYALNIPIGKEKVNFIGSIYAIFINIALTVLLVPLFKQNGAAISIIASEFFIFFYSFFTVKESRQFIDMSLWIKNIMHSVLGFILIILFGYFVKYFVTNVFLYFPIIVAGSVVLYVVELVLFKNSTFLHTVDLLKTRFLKKG